MNNSNKQSARAICDWFESMNPDFPIDRMNIERMEKINLESIKMGV